MNCMIPPDIGDPITLAIAIAVMNRATLRARISDGNQ